MTAVTGEQHEGLDLKQVDPRGIRAHRGLVNRAGARAADRSREHGFTLIEVLVSFTVFVVTVLAFVKVIAGSMAATTHTHQATLAHEGARRMIETLQDEDFGDVFARYNGTALDDPGGVGNGPGPDFPIEGLQAQQTDPDGLPGEVLFPVAGLAPGVLREDLVNVRFGTPRDLSGDGVVDGADHSGDYGLLPVVVRVDYEGPSGPGRVELRTFLGNIQ